MVLSTFDLVVNRDAGTHRWTEARIFLISSSYTVITLYEIQPFRGDSSRLNCMSSALSELEAHRETDGRSNKAKILDGTLAVNNGNRGSSGASKSSTVLFSLYLFLPVFAILAPFLSFTRYHHYELWRPELALAVLPIIAIGLCFGLLVALWPRTRAVQRS